MSSTAAGPARANEMLAFTELALAGLTCAAAYGLVRLFVDASFAPEVLAFAITAHALAAACRRRGLSPAATSVVSGAALVLLTSWLLLGETTLFGIPTSETARTLREEMIEAWRQFGDVKAPSPVLPGFVTTAALGTWGLAFLADAAAFRAGAMVEAMIPASTLFVFGSALGAPRQRLLCTTLFAAALLAFWLSARAHQQLSSPSFMAREGGSATRSILRAGAVIGAVGVVAAVLVGPNLPGADAKAIIPWRASDRSGGASRVTVSPLVDIRTRIVDQAPVEVFKVRSTARSYWRLTALETFDGRIWSSNRQYRRAEGALDAGTPADHLATATVTQEFSVTALASIWLPAAFRPVRIRGTEARYDAESGSLLTEEATAMGQSYVVESAIPQVDAAQLSTATAPVGSAIAATYLALPADFPPRVVALARAAAQGAATPYDGAKQLQDLFRDGSFTYDLSVAPGHGDDALQRFLFETRRGYCEQFAGAYAAMARAVGLPSRVAVGFTTGELGPDGVYSVRGYHGHAWPEVHLAGYGWIAFEPTPGRGIPGSEAYTGVPEQQAAPGTPNTPTTLGATTTVAPAAGQGATTIPELGSSGAASTIGDAAKPPSVWPRRVLITLLVLLAVPLLWILGVLLWLWARRWRRRAAAATPADRVIVAWEELREALARSGVPARRSETPTEFAERASRLVDLDPGLLDDLALLTTAGRFAPPGAADIDEAAVDPVISAARDAGRALAQRSDTRAKVRRLLDPRVPADR